jgi:hypothetical protein
MNAQSHINLIAHLETEPGPMYDREAFYKQQLLAAIAHAKCAMEIYKTEEWLESMNPIIEQAKQAQSN